MFWPQVTRALDIMFCLLLPTRLALGRLAADKVPDASGFFNQMRNLRCAIGLALPDTVIYSRAAGHGVDLLTPLQTGALAREGRLTLAINDAWAMIALLSVAVLACVPFMKRTTVT
jgi:DHA2 family multidrug resistance protein